MKAAATRQRALRRRWIALLSVVTVVALGYLLYFTSFLGVASVEVIGASAEPPEVIRAAAAVPERQPMLRVNTGEIAARIDKLPGVASVDVSRSWPSTIKITVTERTPVAFFTDPDGAHLVDATGLAYKVLPNTPEGLPELSLARIAPDDPVTRSAVAVLMSLPEALKHQITTVRAQTPGGVEFTLKNGKVVRWGDATDPDRKAKVLAVLLTRNGHTYDVASPELPTVS
ncbi:cell division protein FtsQ/DivIB [Amycolatopsis taiwanensis]|uniref:cell division protein FtsQ/DivIB n=1 Tax=Amycolatopsis taiwanensis TaxID=342230 RepID=UPI001FE0B422|nr:FtsQ-type POTRA domain-containing protein [Amycolatopsis taiwanensis]